MIYVKGEQSNFKESVIRYKNPIPIPIPIPRQRQIEIEIEIAIGIEKIERNSVIGEEFFKLCG
jgi:hypothetical protein